MRWISKLYQWLVPDHDPELCACGRPGTVRAWGQWYCPACEAKRVRDNWP